MNVPAFQLHFFRNVKTIQLFAIMWIGFPIAASQSPESVPSLPVTSPLHLEQNRGSNILDRSQNNELMIIAHRGGVVDERRSENSRAALIEAIARGYTHVEVDARMTGDGQVVCFHDDDLAKETGVKGRISEMTADLVTRIRLTRSEETIPSFSEYCAWSSGRIGLMVDIKGCPKESIDQYVSEITTALKRNGLLETALILINKTPKNNQEAIAERFLGRARVSWRKPLSETRTAIAEDADFAKYYYVFCHGDELSRDELTEFKQLGLDVICSINTNHYKAGDPIQFGLQHLETMLKYGVDGLQIDSCYDSDLLKQRNP